MKKQGLADLIAGALFVLLAIGTFILSGSLASTKTGLGPAGYPRIVAAIMLVLGLITIVKSVAKGLPLPEWKINRTAVFRVAGTVALSTVYLWLLRHLGFLYLTPFFLFAVMMLFGYKNMKVAALASVGSAILVYLLFTKVFVVFLPEFTLF